MAQHCLICKGRIVRSKVKEGKWIHKNWNRDVYDFEMVDGRAGKKLITSKGHAAICSRRLDV